MSGADPGVTQLAARFAGLRLALSRDEAGRALDEEAPAAEPASAVEAAQLPTAPVEVLAKALRLHGAEDPCSRLRRAWEPGLGARRVLEGRYKRPGATAQAPAGYRNRCYVVLRGPQLGGALLLRALGPGSLDRGLPTVRGGALPRLGL